MTREPHDSGTHDAQGTPAMDLWAVVSRPLPALWDGARVEWGEFKDLPATFICPPAKTRDRCSRCGSQRARLASQGIRHPLEGETFASEEVRTTRRTRTEYYAPTLVPAFPVMRFIAYRCQDCGLDQVWDSTAWVLWDLDESDYGPEGSVEP